MTTQFFLEKHSKKKKIPTTTHGIPYRFALKDMSARGKCTVCKREYAINGDGKMRKHKTLDGKGVCVGSGGKTKAISSGGGGGSGPATVPCKPSKTKKGGSIFSG